MAMRILSSRMVQANLPLRASVTSSASMSTKSSDNVPTKATKRRKESLRSYIAFMFGGKVDPADPNDAPIEGRDIIMPHTVEQATGEKKLFLLAFENGILDPYCNLPVERSGLTTKDDPIKIEAFGNERLVACACEPTQNHVKYTWVHRGEPKRCQCGHWLELVDAPKFWQKIPKEDLLEIPFFADLEEQGKLDELMTGDCVEKPDAKQLKPGHH